jgi:hypothetical protein
VGARLNKGLVTAGSRVHSRYQRTIGDLAFGGRSLTLKLLVRKWICPEALCSQHIKASRFPEVVQRYARMTDRLIKALQSTGVLTKGAGAAQIASSFGMPTTAKTIIRARDRFSLLCPLRASSQSANDQVGAGNRAKAHSHYSSLPPLC